MRRFAWLAAGLLVLLAASGWKRSRYDVSATPSPRASVPVAHALPAMTPPSGGQGRAPSGGERARAAEEEQARSLLERSLRGFAQLESYRFELDYALQVDGAEPLNVRSIGRVRGHGFTHAWTTARGATTEVVSAGGRAVSRPDAAGDWQPIDADGGGAGPELLLALLDSGLMRQAGVTREREADVDGARALVLAMPWSQPLDDEESSGTLRFYLDPATLRILRWTLESTFFGGEPPRRARSEVSMRVSGLDEAWDIALPDDVRSYLGVR